MMFPRYLSLVLLLILIALVVPVLSASEKPNIVLILADDLGWADLPIYGNAFNETPAIDRLAAGGMRFTQFYSGAVCSPTRANLQSGRNEARFGITQHIPGHRRPFAKLIDPPVPLQLPLEVETFAERLGTAGYVAGYFGKWHLGGAGYTPAEQGWGTVIECQKHEIPPSLSGKGGAVRTAAFLTEKAVEFIETHHEQPFVLQISHYAVHIPLTTRPELLVKYKKKNPMPGYPSLPEYAGLLEELDESVGGIVAVLERLDLSRKTVLVFTSDNGGLVHDQAGRLYTSNLPLRGEKGTLYEGGIRVPAIMYWPGVIPEGVVCETPAITTDLYPTFLELGGVAPPEGQTPDGCSLFSLMRDPANPLNRSSHYWHLPHYHHGTPASAIRKGDWKLLEFFEDGNLELYDLSSDPGETVNLAEKEAKKAAELQEELVRWREQIGARMPSPNPGYDPQRASEMAGGKRSKE